MKKESVPLTDSILEVIKALPGVRVAYPNIEFAARVHVMGDSTSTRIQAMPAEIKNFKPFNDMLAGTFFENDSVECVVLREELLVRLKIKLQKNDEKIELSREDSAKGFRVMRPDSLIGQTIKLVTLSVNASKIPNALFSMLGKNPELPFDETLVELKICGIMKRASQFGTNIFSGNIVIPVQTAEKIPKLGFSSVWDILDRKTRAGTYSSIHVRVDEMKQLDNVKKELEKMDVGIFSIADQLDEIKRGFLILDSLLGAIGVIALIVAALGIINTMVMSILERTREIGIMKAIGGSEREIKMIFFVEAAVIGLIGALFGLLLGWLVTRLANVVVNAQIIPEGIDPVNLFYFPLWLIFGAIAFSILISLAAGMYPATRAARIDPVRALRHD
nr:ABC transporter permease [Bacteroidota bacterium]